MVIDSLLKCYYRRWFFVFFEKKEKTKDSNNEFWYTYTKRMGDKEQYTDDIESQIRQARLSIGELEKLKTWLWNNTEGSSSSEVFLHYKKDNVELQENSTIVHFCGADEFARVLLAVDRILKNP